MTDSAETLPTLIDCFCEWEEKTPGKPFLRQPYGDTWKVLTYAEAGQEARKMTAALQAMGLKRCDHIGILSKNCYHWLLADLAIMLGGFVSVPFYASLPKSQLAEVLRKSDVKALFVGKLDAWGEKAGAIPHAVQVIRFPHYAGNAAVEQGREWAELVRQHAPAEGIRPALDDIWTILFTSGTTGSPKGAIHPYKNPALILDGEREENFVGVFRVPNQRFFSFLPLNHVGERIGIEAACLATGGCISFAESIETFAKNLQDTQPTTFFAVPRIWTRFYLAVIEKLPQRKLDVLLHIPIVSGIIKKKILTALGLRHAKIVATGAAITPAHLKAWYKKLGIHLIEAYGMTEVSGAICYGVDRATPPDSVGKPAPRCELKVEYGTGQIMMRTPHVMTGYYKDPELTAAILRDGWIHSGDKGQIDEKGFVKIIGRVNDAFKTSKGQFIIPNPIEEILAGNEYIEQVCVVGMGIPQPIALLNLSATGLAAPQEAVEDFLMQELAQINANLAGYQKLSTLVILREAWSENNQLLTPTLKIRRGKLDETFGETYEAWHQDPRRIIWE